MKLIDRIALPNGLTLQIFDLSRVIAADTSKVEVSFQIKVDLLADAFDNREDYLTVQKAMGNILTYEYKAERTFVSLAEENAAREEIVATFKTNTLKYVSHDQFARKLALSLLRDIRLNPYKYRSRIADDPQGPSGDDCGR